MPVTAETVRLSLLGPPELHLGDAAAPLPRDKRLHLLAYLAINGDWVNRERLADLFWPEGAGGAARRNLRQLLVRVRGVGWPADVMAALETDNQRLRWSLASDVADFYRAVETNDLTAALAAYRGPLLAEADAFEENPFTHWLELEREKLHFAWRESVLRYTADAVKAGRAADALPWLERLLASDDLDEEALAVYMRVCADSGKPAQATRAYRAFARRLEREMGLAPTSATTLLAESIAEQAAKGATQQVGAGKVARPPAAETVVDRLVGREVELAELAYILSDSDRRLITVIGPGGSGKTRLARELARDASGRFPAGGLFVPLEAVAEPTALAGAIASAAGIRLRSDEDEVAQLAAAFGDAPTLLILDGFEQVIDAAALVSRLVRACPGLVAVVTSRVRLDVSGEQLVQLAGLAVPPEGSPGPGAADYDSVILFIDRARRLRPSFDPDAAELTDVMRICRLLGGLPLGIELAAAWVRVMHVGEIAAEIERDLDFLTGTGRDGSARHLSIRACFDASWRLLSAAEQETLARLAVFPASFSRDAAQYVSGASVALLAALVDKSLLKVDSWLRFDRHALVHQFAAERFAQTDTQEATRARHAAFYLDLAEAGRKGLAGPNQAQWLTRLEADFPSFQAALRWYLGQPGGAERALRLSSALWYAWFVRGQAQTGRSMLLSALGASGPDVTQARADALTAAGNLSWAMGEPDEAERHLLEAVAAQEVTGDLVGMARSLNGLGNVATERGDYAGARHHIECSLELWRKVGSKQGIATAVGNLGSIARLQGDFETARSLLEECLAVERELGAPGPVAITLRNLGHVAMSLGQVDAAPGYLAESRTLAESAGDRWALSAALSGQGSLAAALGDDTTARQLFDESLALRRASADKTGVAFMQLSLAGIDVRAGDVAGARERLHEAREVFAGAGDRRGLAAVTGAEADLAAAAGDPTAARERLRAALRQHLDLGDRLGVAAGLERLASWSADEDPSRAVRLLAAADAIRLVTRSPLIGRAHAANAALLGAAEDRLGAEAYAAAWRAGAGWSLAEAASDAMAATNGSEPLAGTASPTAA